MNPTFDNFTLCSGAVKEADDVRNILFRTTTLNQKVHDNNDHDDDHGHTRLFPSSRHTSSSTNISTIRTRTRLEEQVPIQEVTLDGAYNILTHFSSVASQNNERRQRTTAAAEQHHRRGTFIFNGYGKFCY